MRKARLLLVAACLGTLAGGAADAAVQDWITPGNVPEVEAVTLRNEACEAVVWTKPFVRLASFRLAGGKNHLVDFQSPNPVAGPRFLRPLYVTGAKLWLAGDFDGTRFGLLPGLATREENAVSVSIGPDPDLGLEAVVRFELDARQPRLTVSTTLRNAGKETRTAACWWPVTFDPGGRMEAEAMPFPSAPRFRFASWHHDFPVTDPACRIDGGRVALDLDRPLGNDLFQLGFLSREIVVAKPDCRYRLSVLDPVPVPDASSSYPQDGSAAILYRDQRTWFCEAELLGPRVVLPPGTKTGYRFAIALEPVP